MGDESTATIGGGRGRRRWCGGEAELPEGLGSVGEEEGVGAELPGASVRLRDDCGRGSGVGGDELRSVAGGRGSRGEDGDERVSDGFQEGCVASLERPGGSRRWPEAGGGRGAWPRAPGACPSSWQRRNATGEARVGWAG